MCDFFFTLSAHSCVGPEGHRPLHREQGVGKAAVPQPAPPAASHQHSRPPTRPSQPKLRRRAGRRRADLAGGPPADQNRRAPEPRAPEGGSSRAAAAPAAALPEVAPTTPAVATGAGAVPTAALPVAAPPCGSPPRVRPTRGTPARSSPVHRLDQTAADLLVRKASGVAQLMHRGNVQVPMPEPRPSRPEAQGLRVCQELEDGTHDPALPPHREQLDERVASRSKARGSIAQQCGLRRPPR